MNAQLARLVVRNPASRATLTLIKPFLLVALGLYRMLALLAAWVSIASVTSLGITRWKV